MRAFVAVPLGSPEGSPGAAGPLPHLTLHFLRDVPPETLAAIRGALPAAVARHRRFVLSIEGVGAFPSAERPRVVWRGAGEGRAEIEALATTVRRADVAAGAPDDPRPFAAHLTWFRVRGGEDAARARAILDRRAPAPAPVRIDVREVALVVSRLERSGAVHQIVDRFPLASA